MKLCKDCRFVEPRGPGWEHAVCTNPKTQREPQVSPMSGELEQVTMSCWSARSDVEGRCGPDGQYWEARGFV